MRIRATAQTRRAGRERELLADCRAGDGAAWESLVSDYERLVFSIPLGYGLSRDEAADITQIVFTTLLQSLDAIQQEDRLSAWLATVARRQSWRALERARREVVGFDDAPEPVVVDPTEQWTRLEWLYEGLLALDTRCRELLVALYLEQPASYAEVSRRLDRPIGSIGPTRARCLDRLRKVLEQ